MQSNENLSKFYIKNTAGTFPLPSPVEFVIDRLERAGYSAYAVGGCVRDHLMGRVPGDYDVTTSARPDEMLSVFSDCRVVETGLKHGTITVVREGMNIEITAYRVDGKYTDGRHPESVEFTDSILEDISRRDFTVNAMAYSPMYGILDAKGGRRDLKKKNIRCVGRAVSRFREDGLRILRALRFSSTLDFSPDNSCDRAIRKNPELLDPISRERIYAELTKLLCGPGAARIMFAYPDIISHVLPELSPADVRMAAWAIERESAIREKLALNGKPDPALRYALLFSWIGFEAAQRAIASLKPSREEARRIKEYLRRKDDKPECSLPLFGVTKNEYYVKRLSSGSDDDFSEKFPIFMYAIRRVNEDGARTLLDIARKLKETNAAVTISSLAIDGRDAALAGFFGAEIGRALDSLLDGVMRGEIKNEREELLSALKNMKNTDSKRGAPHECQK